MPLEQVLEDVGAEVSDVRVIINRGTAGVQLYDLPGGIERNEGFQLPCVRIEKLNCHDKQQAMPEAGHSMREKCPRVDDL